MSKTPLYTPETVPRIKNAKRLTATRTKQLIRAAARDYNDPPPKPGLGECCGSSCDPCVNDLWREEVDCWRERWGVSEEEMRGFERGGGDGIQRRMPGSFEW